MQRGVYSNQRGNMLFIIFIAVALIGLLTVAIQNGGGPNSGNIDKETIIIRASEVQRYGSELERGINYIIRQNRVSESDIRFAHPDNHADYGDLSADADPSDQVFHRDGGAANYRDPPSGVNDGSPWEFYAGTSIPNVGSERPELMAVLPNVTQQLCQRINTLAGQTSTQPLDTGAGTASGLSPGDCIFHGEAARFDDGQQYYDEPDSTPNTPVTASFTKLPAMQGCLQCPDQAGAPYHFYHVILAR